MHPTDPIIKHFRLIPPQRDALKRLGIETVEDLLYHFPTRYGDTSEAKSIASLQKGDVATIFGKIRDLKTSKGFRTKIPMADGYVDDESGSIHCVWFNQPYLAKMTPDGATVRIEGKVSERRKTGEIYLSNPKIEVVSDMPRGVGHNLWQGTSEAGSMTAHSLYPVYPESRGISSNWMYHAVSKIIKNGVHEKIADPLPSELRKKLNLPAISSAFIWIHSPMKPEDASVARKRFSFEEIFFIQLERLRARKLYEKNKTFTIEDDAGKSKEKDVREFIKRFPFSATPAQEKAIFTILNDFMSDKPMSRLLEGDVGSGKTAVAGATAYAIITSKAKDLDGAKGAKSSVKPKIEMGRGHLQVAYMCPTEILATQHFESFIQFFSYLPIRIALITGSGCRIFPSKLNPKGWTSISKSQLLKWIEEGDISVVIGTHALIQKSVKFKNLAYCIIDEQHRFGTKQRAKLVRKDETGHERAPHLLSMTATPIPRTLALTMYGDLDLSVLDSMPTGRKPVITDVIYGDRRDEMYEKIRSEIIAGRQAYIICPRIDEPDPAKETALLAKSVKEEAKRLKETVFSEFEIGILHGKMSPAEKDRAMNDFKSGKTHILCATSVVEVGVNVPNATLIVIEGGERFGLSQLHQLRGRVIRSNHQAYCYILTTSNNEKTADRLRAMKEARNGFELAEIDLSQRGAGELGGTVQWGVSDIAMEALQNLKMVEIAREEAKKVIDEVTGGVTVEVTDEDWSKYPTIRAELARRARAETEVHFE